MIDIEFIADLQRRFREYFCEMRRNKIKAKKSTKSETSSEDREKVEKILEDMKNGKKGYQLKTEDFEVLERFYGHNWQCIVFE